MKKQMVYGKTIPQNFLSISHETTCDGTSFTNTDFIEIFFHHRCFPVNFEAFFTTMHGILYKDNKQFISYQN